MAPRKGVSGNPAGKPKGTTNKFTFDMKKKLSEALPENFVDGLLADIENTDDSSKKATLKIKLLEFFVPKSKDEAEVEKEDTFRKELMDRIFKKE